MAMADINEKIDVSNVSLLYPTDESRSVHDFQNGNDSGISEYTAEQLELYALLDLKTSYAGDFFTCDRDVILYRQRTMMDVMEHPELSDLLEKILPLLADIKELRRMAEDQSFSTESYLYSITEVELYTSLVSIMKEGLEPLSDSIKSPAFKRLRDIIFTLSESDYYKGINKSLNELTSRVREVKSVTIGVNLDGQLKAEGAGVLSLNNEKFKSGRLLERALRLDFKSGDTTCIAPLIPFKHEHSENQQLALSYALNSALNDVLRSSLRSWKKIIRTYVLENTDFLLRMAPEIEFVAAASSALALLREKGCPMAFPEIAESGSGIFDAKGLVNPVVAVKLNSNVVPNDFSFDSDGMFYILTGPNRGGKSVITCAVGIAFAMAGLGLPVCAESCSISPADKIFTHFPQGSEDTIDKGRLGEECSRLEEIISKITGDSLVLLDESFSSTGSYEGSFIAGEVVAGFALANCRGIFSTHLHDLAARTSELNEKCVPLGGAKIDNLTAEVVGGGRSFKILRKTPDGKSYAADIAEKYGLSFDSIRKKLGKN